MTAMAVVTIITMMMIFTIILVLTPAPSHVPYIQGHAKAARQVGTGLIAKADAIPDVPAAATNILENATVAIAENGATTAISNVTRTARGAPVSEIPAIAIPVPTPTNGGLGATITVPADVPTDAIKIAANATGVQALSSGVMFAKTLAVPVVMVDAIKATEGALTATRGNLARHVAAIAQLTATRCIAKEMADYAHTDALTVLLA